MHRSKYATRTKALTHNSLSLSVDCTDASNPPERTTPHATHACRVARRGVCFSCYKLDLRELLYRLCTVFESQPNAAGLVDCFSAIDRRLAAVACRMAWPLRTAAAADTFGHYFASSHRSGLCRISRAAPGRRILLVNGLSVGVPRHIQSDSTLVARLDGRPDSGAPARRIFCRSHSIGDAYHRIYVFFGRRAAALFSGQLGSLVRIYLYFYPSHGGTRLFGATYYANARPASAG